MYSQTIVLSLKVRAVPWLEQFPLLTTSSLLSLSPLVIPSKNLTLMKKACPFSFLPFPHRLSSQHRHNQPTVQGHMAAGAKDAAGEGTGGGEGRTANTFEVIYIRLFGNIGSFTRALPACCHGSTQHRELEGHILTTRISVADFLI